MSKIIKRLQLVVGRKPNVKSRIILFARFRSLFMSALRMLFGLLIGFYLFTWDNPILAQTWTPTPINSTNNWGPVACSADGTKLVVANYQAGPIYTSTNSGMTWATNSVPDQDWKSVATSADGSEFFAVNIDNNLLYISTNCGTTWFSNNVPGLTRSEAMACSADGTKVAVAGGGVICVSTDSLATWTTNNPTTYDALAFSADGTKLFASGGSIGISTNYGLTWADIGEPNLDSYSVACSADGSRLVVANSLPYSPGYISTNSGATWTPISVLGGCNMVASSAEGTTIAAAGYWGGVVCTSTDFGATWTTNDLPVGEWFGVASSADGNKLVAVIGGFNNAGSGGAVYTSYTPPSPQLNLAPASGNLTLSWVVPSTNFFLQQNLDLTTGNWVTLTNTPTLIFTNLQNQVMLTPVSSEGFYRLAAP